MLDPVALHQTRFNTPGVVPDGRGVLLGKLGALLFPAVDALVGFFRVFGEEASLDELLPKLRIEEVRGQTGARQFLVLFHAASSYLTDRAARLSALLGGAAFTGSGKHFVRYRDARSPLGYDARQLSTDPADFLVYDERYTLALSRVRELPFAQLVLRLSPRALPGLKDPELERDRLWLLAREGMARPLLGYLWRNQQRASAGAISPVSAEAGAAFAGRPRWLIVRVETMPERLLHLFSTLPGVEVYSQVGERCLVQLGYRHPIRLEACASLFEADKLYVFSGSRDAAEIFDMPALVTVAGLVERGFQLDERGPPAMQQAALTQRIAVPLRLEPAEIGDKVSAVLVPWAQATWLRRFVYAAPQRLLERAKLAALDEGLLVVADDGLMALPIGRQFWQPAPGVLIPIGHRLEPAVAPGVLTEHLGADAGKLVIFPLPIGATPFSVSVAEMLPLGRSALEHTEVTSAGGAALALPAPDREAIVEHGPPGLFPLWGFRDDEPG